MPAGITISCFGDANSSRSGELFQVSPVCQDHLILNASDNTGILEIFNLSSAGGFQITNTTDVSIPGFLLLETDFTSFNAGGPQIGASVTYPGLEDAGFSSSVLGTGVEDMHSCNTDGSSPGGTNFSPYACGVEAPDSSQEFLELSIPGAGQSGIDNEQIRIGASLFGVPEPATLALFGAGLLGMGFFYRRRAIMRAP